MNKIKLAVMVGVLTAGVAHADTINYTIDSGHTFPSFEIQHFGLSLQRGRFNKTSGKISWDNDTKKGIADVVIQSSSISTGNPDLEKHLKTADFFHVDKYPTLSFKGNKVDIENGKPIRLYGQLTIKNITKPVVFKIDNWMQVKHPMLGKPALGVDAVATIKRSDFDMKYSLPGVRDDVTIKLNVEAIGE